MVKFQTRYLSKDEFSTWDGFVDSMDEGKIFHKFSWLNSIYSTQNNNIDVRIIASIGSNGQIMGGLAFGSLQKFGVRLVVPPILSQYWGLLLSHRQSKYDFKDLNFRMEIMDSIIHLLEQDHKIIEMNLPPEITDIRKFSWHGYQQKVRYTFRKQLASKKGVFSELDPALKRQINKAEKQGVEALKGNSDELSRQFFALQSMSLKRQRQEQTFKLSFQQFIALIHKLKKADFTIQFYVAYKYNNPVAGTAILSFKSTAYYWLAGGDPGHFNTGANQLIMSKVFSDLISQNIKYFDFVGANTPSVASYKSSYNFNLVPYYRVERTIGIYPKVLMEIKKILFR